MLVSARLTLAEETHRVPTTLSLLKYAIFPSSFTRSSFCRSLTVHSSPGTPLSSHLVSFHKRHIAASQRGPSLSDQTLKSRVIIDAVRVSLPLAHVFSSSAQSSLFPPAPSGKSRHVIYQFSQPSFEYSLIKYRSVIKSLTTATNALFFCTEKAINVFNSTSPLPSRFWPSPADVAMLLYLDTPPLCISSIAFTFIRRKTNELISLFTHPSFSSCSFRIANCSMK